MMTSTSARGKRLRWLLVAGLLLGLIPFVPPAVAATAWQPVADMHHQRVVSASVTLPNGRVVVMGGATSADGVTLQLTPTVEIYNPTNGVWTERAPMRVPRYGHSATLLNDGTILVAGGFIVDGGAPEARLSTEIFDPISNTWIDGPDLNYEHVNHEAILLPNGDVFIAGGANSGEQALTERYDPTAGAWIATASMSTDRSGHTTTLLEDGTVLVAGGTADGSAERYDPATDTWSPAGTMSGERDDATATRLLNGDVLVAAGTGDLGQHLATAERYDPVANSWSPAGTLAVSRVFHRATLLTDGSVMLVGGQTLGDSTVASVEIYNPDLNVWAQADSMTVSRAYPDLALLGDGSVLVFGGAVTLSETSLTMLRSAERYPPNQLPTVTRTPLQSLRLGTLKQTSIPVTISWDASDADGIAAYQLRRQRNGGAFTGVTLPNPQVETITQYLQPGGSHRYRVRATDSRGTESAPAFGPNTALEARNEEHVSITYTGSWSTQANPKFFGGSSRLSGSSTAVASLAFTGTSVSWVTSRGPGRGMAEVWLDGVKQATFDLYTPTFRVRQVMFARNGLTNAPHTLEIRVLGAHNPASSGNRVDVDVFVVLI